MLTLVGYRVASLVVRNSSWLDSYRPVAGSKKFKPVASSVYELVMARPRLSTVTRCQTRWCGPASTLTGPLASKGGETCPRAHNEISVSAEASKELVFINCIVDRLRG